MVEIALEKCIGCGRCVEDCLPHNLYLKEGKAHVLGNCMQCGHCFAVCPVHAVTISDYPTDGVIEFTHGKPVIQPDDFLNFLKSRRSIRNYQKRNIEKEVWEKILEAGRFTPTAENAQDMIYTIVQDKLEEVKKLVWEGMEQLVMHMENVPAIDKQLVQLVKKINLAHKKNPETDLLFFQAPALLIVSSPFPLNGGLASSNIELMANAEGLGVLYSGFIQGAVSANSAVCDMLGLQKDWIRSCMLIGYPSVQYQRTVPRKKTNIQWQ